MEFDYQTYLKEAKGFFEAYKKLGYFRNTLLGLIPPAEALSIGYLNVPLIVTAPFLGNAVGFSLILHLLRKPTEKKVIDIINEIKENGYLDRFLEDVKNDKKLMKWLKKHQKEIGIEL